MSRDKGSDKSCRAALSGRNCAASALTQNNKSKNTKYKNNTIDKFFRLDIIASFQLYAKKRYNKLQCNVQI